MGNTMMTKIWFKRKQNGREERDGSASRERLWLCAFYFLSLASLCRFSSINSSWGPLVNTHINNWSNYKFGFLRYVSSTRDTFYF